MNYYFLSYHYRVWVEEAMNIRIDTRPNSKGFSPKKTLYQLNIYKCFRTGEEFNNTGINYYSQLREKPVKLTKEKLESIGIIL